MEFSICNHCGCAVDTKDTFGEVCPECREPVSWNDNPDDLRDYINMAEYQKHLEVETVTLKICPLHLYDTDEEVWECAGTYNYVPMHENQEWQRIKDDYRKNGFVVRIVFN